VIGTADGHPLCRKNARFARNGGYFAAAGLPNIASCCIPKCVNAPEIGESGAHVMLSLENSRNPLILRGHHCGYLHDRG
jgi:hypothetical protein